MPEWTISLQGRVIKRFTIEEGSRLTIGRGAEANVIIDNAAISRLHTAITLHSGILFLEDLNSTNGTFVNGERITSETPVALEDSIAIGKFLLAPATAAAGKATASFATSMDLEEETVFVAPKLKAGTDPRPAPAPAAKGGHRLQVVSGRASPAELFLEGRSSIKIGKDPSCDLRLVGWLVARAQCYIIGRDGKFFVVPQRSFAGTWLNGLRIRSEHLLRKGDVLTIRHTKIRYE